MKLDTLIGEPWADYGLIDSGHGRKLERYGRFRFIRPESQALWAPARDDWQADGEPLQRAAAGHESVTFLFPENTNHVLKFESRPRGELAQPEAVPRYNAPDAKLDPDAMSSIVAWLAAHI